MTPHYNCLGEMRGNNVCFDRKIWKIIPVTPSYLELLMHLTILLIVVLDLAGWVDELKAHSPFNKSSISVT